MSILEQPQYAGLRGIICNDWDYALHLSINPHDTWKEIQYRLTGMAEYARMLKGVPVVDLDVTRKTVRSL